MSADRGGGGPHNGDICRSGEESNLSKVYGADDGREQEMYDLTAEFSLGNRIVEIPESSIFPFAIIQISPGQE